MNLLEETKEVMSENGLNINDIIFIGSEQSGHECTWSEYEQLANIEYDSGHGTQEIASDLIIAFSNGTIMDRAEYEGQEWWDLHEPFKRPINKFEITSLKKNYLRSTLQGINDSRDDHNTKRPGVPV